jgi:hypothetical protein
MKKKKATRRDITTKDEMNLAEYPIQLLTKDVPEETKTIEWHGEVTLKDGEKKEASWVVTGSDKYGLPRYPDRDVILAIMYYWYRQGFKSPELVIDNIADMLRLMKWDVNEKGYKRLKEALDRLVHTGISATYTFWDNENKDYMPYISFNLFQSAKIRNIPNRKRGYRLEVKASDVFWESIKSNYIKSLNATFYFSLKNPTAKALYTFLDKKAYQNEEFSMEIYNLASKLGLSTRQPKFKLKQTLKEASEILLNKGFLSYYEFKDIPETRDELIVFYFNKEYLSEEEIELREKHEEYVKLIVSDILQVVGDTKSKAFYEKVARSIPQEIIYRALSEVKAASLDGEIKTTKAKLFTYLVKKYAKELFNLKI